MEKDLWTGRSGAAIPLTRRASAAERRLIRTELACLAHPRAARRSTLRLPGPAWPLRAPDPIWPEQAPDRRGDAPGEGR
jgi:hypothetical protein